MNTGGHAPDDEVRTLQRQVKRHLKQPHIFQCITEREINGVFTVKPINDLPGWWGKLNLFSGSVAHSRNLWLDLDVTITQDIDALVEPLNGSQLRIAKNWAQSGHGGCQSSVMYWEGTKASYIYESFDHKDAHWPPVTGKYWDNGKGVRQVLHGDQEWITFLRDTGRINVEYFHHNHVVSFKYHCQQGLPPKSLVQCWHGKPDPCERMDIDWVRKARS